MFFPYIISNPPVPFFPASPAPPEYVPKFPPGFPAPPPAATVQSLKFLRANPFPPAKDISGWIHVVLFICDTIAPLPLPPE